MIERIIKNENTLRRYRRFKSKKLAVISIFALIIMVFISCTGFFWANNRPLIMKYNGKLFYPVLIEYHPSDLGITDLLDVDFRTLEMGSQDWAVWPLIKWNPFESNDSVDSYPAPPSKVNYFGTDDRGRDVLVRLLYGFKNSMIYALFVWLICTFLGSIAGSVMGYFGGRIDFFSQRIVEILSTVPQFFLLIIIISIFQPNLFILIVISCLFGWISISYYIRGEFLKNRKREYVEAARAIGASKLVIIFKHIFPNSLAPIITFTPFMISNNVLSLASLDYLGFGIAPPAASWGELLNQAHQNFTIAWWLAVFPSLALFGTLVMLNIIGEAVRDAIDPR